MLQQNGQAKLGRIEGDLFPPTWSAQLMSQLLSYTFFIGLFLVFAGEWFFSSVLSSDAGLRAVRFMKANQVVTMIILMGCNMMANSLISTGAFEVFFNNQLVFSKLATGHAPDLGNLLAAFHSFKGNGGNEALDY